MRCRYTYSLYFSVSAFTGLGDGDFFATSPAEAVCVIMFMLCNVVLAAYCLGESACPHCIHTPCTAWVSPIYLYIC